MTTTYARAAIHHTKACANTRVAVHSTPSVALATTNPTPRRQLVISPPPQGLDYQEICEATNRSPESLSRTSAKVIHRLLTGDLSRLRSEFIADELGISPTTLRRRLRADQVSYQELLDLARQYRCEKLLSNRWVPGKTMAWDLGYAEVNSFYRAFKRWTGISYSEVKLRYI